jgi:hypothetical protein
LWFCGPVQATVANAGVVHGRISSLAKILKVLHRIADPFLPFLVVFMIILLVIK